MIKLVCFDVGGTLFNYKLYRDYIKQVCALFNISDDKIKMNYNKYLNLMDESIETFIYNDVNEALRLLTNDGFQLGIVSNAIHNNVFTLDELGIAEFFKYIVYSFEVGYKKPDIGIFKAVEKMTGLNSGEIALVGDSLKSDVFGANNAGWLPIYLDRTGNYLENNCPYPNYIINNLTQLSTILNQFNNNKIIIG